MDTLVRTLDNETDLSLVLDLEGRIVFVNHAWRTESERLQSAAVGPERVLGARYVDAIVGEIRHSVEHCIEEVVTGRAPFGITLHSECNTPAELRHLSSYFAPLRDADGRIEGVLVRHSIRAMGSISAHYEIAEAPAESMRDTHGFLNQCCCCRRVRDSRDDHWRVLLPAMEHSLPATSHGYCTTCLFTYYQIEAGGA